jgi:hypothetical protein
MGCYSYDNTNYSDNQCFLYTGNTIYRTIQEALVVEYPGWDVIRTTIPVIATTNASCIMYCVALSALKRILNVSYKEIATSRFRIRCFKDKGTRVKFIYMLRVKFLDIKGQNLIHVKGQIHIHVKGPNLIHVKGPNLIHVKGPNLIHANGQNLIHVKGQDHIHVKGQNHICIKSQEKYMLGGQNLMHVNIQNPTHVMRVRWILSRYNDARTGRNGNQQAR